MLIPLVRWWRQHVGADRLLTISAITELVPVGPEPATHELLLGTGSVHVTCHYSTYALMQTDGPAHLPMLLPVTPNLQVLPKDQVNSPMATGIWSKQLTMWTIGPDESAASKMARKDTRWWLRSKHTVMDSKNGRTLFPSQHASTRLLIPMLMAISLQSSTSTTHGAGLSPALLLDFSSVLSFRD